MILASASPRRKELLKKITEDFTISPSNIDESTIEEKDPLYFAIKAATLKAKDIAQKKPSEIVIGADTIVVMDDQILGKPKDEKQAREFLNLLSNKKHRVITGMAMYKKDQNKLLTDYEITYVIFNKLSEKDIDDYIQSKDYQDKAGAYAVQTIGGKFVKEVQGDYDNVVGLPVRRLKKLIKKFNYPECSMEIKDIALPNNWGVAKADKLVVFVPNALPGQKAKVRALKKNRNYYYGEIVKMEEESPFKVKAECPHFGSCGGCAFQNLDYKKQLEVKENYLHKTFKNIGKIDLEKVKMFPITPSPEKFYYRNKMEFAFGGEKKNISLGLRQRFSPLNKYERGVIPIEQCKIFSPVVEKIFPIILKYVNEKKLTAYDTKTQKGFLRHLLIREGKTTKDLMVLFITRSGKLPGIDKLIPKLTKALPDLKSLYHVENDRISDVVSFDKVNHIFGEQYIEDIVHGLTFRIYPQTFFQPNIKAAEKLYDKLFELSEISKDSSVLGLYSGAGPIEIFLSQKAKNVIGIDSNPVNIANAIENANINNRFNCYFHEGDVEKVLKNTKFEKPDLLITDPPRGGITVKGIKLILNLEAKKLAYVSCNPASLARDLKILQDEGYMVKSVSPFDFFPHTTHLETLVILEKA